MTSPTQTVATPSAASTTTTSRTMAPTLGRTAVSLTAVRPDSVGPASVGPAPVGAAGAGPATDHSPPALAPTRAGGRLEPEEAIARVELDLARARERAEVAARVQQQVAEVRGTGRTRAGEVVAVTDAAGRLVDLRLSASALQATPAALARTILQATRDAEADASARTLGLVAEAFGDHSGVVARLREEIADRTRPRTTAAGAEDLVARTSGMRSNVRTFDPGPDVRVDGERPRRR